MSTASLADPLDAVVASVVTYLTTALGPSIRVVAGWPASREEWTLTKPIVAVTATEVERELHPVEAVCRLAVDGADATYLWRYAHVVYRVRLDLYARSKAKRREVGASIEAALHNDIPHRPGLYLSLSGYHDRPIELYVDAKGEIDESPDVESEDGPATDGEWRRFWLLTSQSDLVVRASSKRQAQIHATITTYSQVDDTGAPTDGTTEVATLAAEE